MLFLCFAMIAQNEEGPTNTNSFRQLYTELPTPNVYRNAAGAPGHMYWQQRADYKMKIRLDDENQRVYGEEKVKYYNNSPDALEYLWLQLDQNMRAKNSDTYKIRQSQISDRTGISSLRRLTPTFDGGFKIDHVRADNGREMKYTINKTMMRIDLPKPLAKGETVEFDIKWWYNINDRMKIGGRSGMEYFPEEDNYIYTIAQFFPRMAVYDDKEGWQNKQFLGSGEFALTFGDYDVEITVPDDHLVSATGVLQNEGDVMTKTQRDRWERAKKSYEDPVIVVTEEEAIENEKTKSTKEKTWKFKAENVRDFAFASSRKFIWDAMAVKQSDGTTAIAASMYPKEGNPLWEQYSTRVVAHTLKWYSHYTFPYPYPIAWSIHTARIGMEYPMICFNFGRPEADGTYTQRTKYGMIGVIIHEVGHNYFPMIVNSDERQWTWMDEGLNSFVQYLAEQQWERDYPSRYGLTDRVIRYMSGDKDRVAPIMTNSESIWQFGNNAYAKPAAALNVLRETIMGRELFDYAFKTYANRWRFKHPDPADFFRTMEDASAVDLDWFWRSWFFTNDHVDLQLVGVRSFQLDNQDPDLASQFGRDRRSETRETISKTRNREVIAQTEDERIAGARDFYTSYDPLDVTVLDRQEYQEYYNNLSADDRAFLNGGGYFYEVTVANNGGIPMPIILEFEHTDGTKVKEYVPAEIWKMDSKEVTKIFVLEKPVAQIVLDPDLETGDSNTEDNYFPSRPQLNRFELFKRQQGRENPMQRNRRAEETEGR